jgi:uncharacterized protein (DUF362 family)
MPTDRWNSARGMIEQADPKSVLANLGLLSLDDIPGVEVVLFDREAWVRRESPTNGTWPDGIPIAIAAADADFLIELVQLKTHWITGFSGALKALMGLLPLEGTRYIHAAPSARLGRLTPALGSRNIPASLRRRLDYCRRIAALATARRPNYVIVDGRTAYAAEGPCKGPVVQSGWMAATADPVAAELICLALLAWIWWADVETDDGEPIRDWYARNGSVVSEHNGRIDVLQSFRLRDHPMIRAAVGCRLWESADVPVQLDAEGVAAEDLEFLLSILSV